MNIYLHTVSLADSQDLSLAGLRKGMKKGESTRSGMLWEVERILDECKELNTLPNILFMENVPEVIGKNNIKDFQKWIEKLESLGYSNYVECLNSKDYGVPQNRNRCFMISILGEYSYKFPLPFKLKLRLKDLLESNVDEKYYLSDKMINFFKENSKKNETVGNGFRFKPINEKEAEIAKTITTRAGGRMDDNFIEENFKNKEDGICITLTTRTNASNNTFICEPEATKKGYAEAHEGDGVYINRPHQKRGVVQKGMIQTLKTSPDVGVVVESQYSEYSLKKIKGNIVQDDVVGTITASAMQSFNHDNCHLVVEENRLTSIEQLLLDIFDLCCIIDTKEKDKYERSRELLQILWEEIGKEEIWQEIRRFISIQEKKILQSNLYEKELYEDRKPQSKISTSTSNSSEYNESITNREKMFNMWEKWKTRYTPQRWELSKQQFRQFNLFMQKLPYETTQGETSMQDMWQTNERFRLLQQTLFKIQEIWRPYENKISNGLRIRKLTPREAFRLMGVKDEDFDKIKNNQSDSSLYHLAGDSIVVDVMKYMFKNFL